jgi:hypothetical protein
MMKKILMFVLLMFIAVQAQQINHGTGTNLAGESLSRFVYLTATDGANNYVYFDMDDYYFVDWYPLFVTEVLTLSGDGPNDVGMDTLTASTTTTVYSNSDRMYIGTLYISFDTQGAAPTADSVYHLIKAAPGIYTSASESLASADFGSEVTLETVAEVGDYFSINNVYIHSTATKVLCPQILRINIDNHADVSSVGADDSVAAYIDFAYPAIYTERKTHK